MQLVLPSVGHTIFHPSRLYNYCFFLAYGSWYVNILGVYETARGQGVGSAMLARADAIAAQSGARGTSIIVFSANPGAERLYRRSGYEEVARRQMDYPGWQHDGCEAILLVKD